MDILHTSVVWALLLFGVMVGFAEIGRILGLRRAKRDPDNAWHGLGIVDGAVLGLLGLIVAFSFSGAASRFDVRRNLVVDESNAIGTAYLRLDLLPDQSQPDLRASFRRYLDSRIRLYERFPDVAAVKAELEIGKKLQAEIWTQARTAAQESQVASMLLLPALNQVFDIANSRTLNTMIHPPLIIYAMMFGLALISSMYAGYGMAGAYSHSLLHPIGFAAVTAIAFYVIIDLEYPRLGAIHIEAIDEALKSLRSSMN